MPDVPHKTYFGEYAGTKVEALIAKVCRELESGYLLYVDPNRRVEDIDTSMIDGQWSGPVDLSPKTKSGIGLIWRVNLSILRKSYTHGGATARRIGRHPIRAAGLTTCGLRPI